MTLQDLKNQYDSLTLERSKLFIKNIHTVFVDESISRKDLIGFLEKSLEDFAPEGRRICSQPGQMSSKNRERISLHGKIVAALMIILQNTRSYTTLREKTLLFLTYSAAVVKKEYDFTEMFLDVLSWRIVATGLDWHALQEAQSLDILCHALKEGLRFDKGCSEPFSFIGKGKAECRDGGFRICSSDVGEAGSTAFTFCNERIAVVTRNVREEKLKASERDEVETLARFTDMFMKTQDEYVAPAPKAREYKNGDVVDIMITGENLACVIVDANKDVKGRIVDEELMRGTTTKDLDRYLCLYDCIRNAVIVDMDEEGFIFSIRDTYMTYALERAKDDDRKCVVMEAVVTGIRDDLYDGRITWMTPSGYGGISFPLQGRNLKIGDKAVLSVINIQTNNKSMFINLWPPKYDYENIRRFGEDDEDVLAAFVTTEENIRSLKGGDAEAEKQCQDAEAMRMLASVLVDRSFWGTGLDAYWQKIVALFLSKLTGDEEVVKALIPELFYRRCCIAFAQGSAVSPEIPYVLPEEQEQVVRMLAMWDAKAEDLMSRTAALPSDSLPGKIGALVLGKSLSARYRDEIVADDGTVREKICSLIGVEPLFRTGYVSRKGKYGKAESQEVEFKSSYVYRNDNGMPDIDYQGRGQVFEAVCGFLNADGGTVYLGVSNDGDPIVAKDYGLNADIEWLRSNFKFLNGMRARQLGHAICEVKDLDSYVQFLNSEKELYFKESLLGNIVIEETEDADAIKITVTPAEFEIAYLYTDKTHTEGQAFVRDGGRTIPMSRIRKEQRLSELKKIGKEMSFVVAIQEAIDRHGKLLFKGYASGNSGEVKDRQVVPINLFYNDENVYCYDLVSRKNKQFRLHRISSIETLPGIYTLKKSAPQKADVFRWLSEDGKTYHIKLRMDVGARNYLLEEYSCAEKLPKEEFYEEKKDKWILDTRLNGLGAVRRFYLGLADKIEILDTEDSEKLKEAIAEYVSENINAGS